MAYPDNPEVASSYSFQIYGDFGQRTEERFLSAWLFFVPLLKENKRGPRETD
jgi:hypothetical protein